MNPGTSPDRPRRDDLSSPAEGPLTERERRYRTLFGAMDEGFVVLEMVFDDAGRPVDYLFLEFNDAFTRMTGIPAEAALSGRSARDLYPTLEELWFETYGRVAATGEPVRFENGAEAMGRWFEVHAFRIGGEGSREVGVLFKDVSERRRAETDRERERAFLDLVTESLPVRVGYIGPDLRYRYMNRTYETAFGLPPGGGVGVSVVDLAGQEPFERAEPYLRRALGGEAQFQALSVDYPNGRRRLEVNYIPDSQEGGVVVHVSDVTERYERERRLDDARARRDRALEDAEVATYDWDAVNDRVYANGLLAHFFGISGDDVHGGPIERYFAAIHPDDRSRTQAAIGRALATGGRYQTEYRVTDAEGTVRHVLARGDAARDREGKPLRLSGVVLDISDRARADREVAEREELFRTVFEQAPDDAILVMDAHRTLTAWNPAAERIAGWSAAEAVGSPADLIFTPEDRAAGLPAREIEEAARLGKAVDERWHMRKDGSRFWGSGTMNALHDAEGRVRGYLKVFRDATARYEETQTLAFLSLLTESVIEQREPDAILETVERMLGNYLGAARVAFAEVAPDGETFAIRREWAPDHPSLLGTHRLEEFGPVVGDVLRAGGVHVSRDATAESAEDAGRDAVARFGIGSGVTVPVLTEGRLASFVVVHGDVPRDWTEDEVALVRQVADRVSSEIERARAESALREANGTLETRVQERTEELQRAVREAEGFNYSISHDLRTPLRAMVSTASILLEEAAPSLDEEHRLLLVRQAENAKRMGRLIDELLRLSRLARVEVHREPLDLTAKAISVWEELTQHHGTESCEIDVQPGMRAEGDAGLVRTVFHNLLGNACKFSPQGGPIRVRQEGPVLSVSDEGVGFDMRFAPKIFLPFERLVAEHEFEGTGIGLANVKRIVERHGGRVWVESAVGEGTTFSFTLGPE